MTAAENAANLRSARNIVAVQLGVDQANLSYSERIEFNRRVASEILAHPARFDAATIATAQSIAGKAATELEDDSFDWGDFAGDTGENILKAGEKVAGVGNGVLTLASWGSWAIPLAGLVLLALVVWRLSKRVPA